MGDDAQNRYHKLQKIERKNGMKIRTFAAPVPGGPETGMKIKRKMTGVF